MTIRQGFGLVEIIVAMGIMSTIMVTGALTVVGSFSTNRLGGEETEAAVMAQEGIEAVRSIKNQGWLTPFLATDCTSGCGVSSGGGSWAWSGTENVQAPFTRTITVSDVQRNGSDTIVTSGGSDDPDTKLVTSEVVWSFSPTRNNSISVSTYLTNFRKSIFGDWSLPQLQSSFDLTAGNSGNAGGDAVSLSFANNYIFLGRSSSTGTELLAINVSDLANPSLCANCQRELGGNVEDIVVRGNYAYIASSNNAQELQIININTPSSLNTATLSTLDLTAGNSGNGNADAVAIGFFGSSLYMVRAGGNELLRFNVTMPTSPSLTSTGSDLTGTPTGMAIVGNYAFVTSDDNAAELQVMNLSTMARDAVLNLDNGNDNADATSIVYVGNNRLLVGRAGSTAPELYTINISTPTSPAVTSTLEIGDTINDISFGNDLIFLAYKDKPESRLRVGV